MQDMLGLPVGGATGRERRGKRRFGRGTEPIPMPRPLLDTASSSRLQSLPYLLLLISFSVRIYANAATATTSVYLATTSLVGLNIFLCFASFLSFSSFFFAFLFRYCCCFSLVLAEHVWKFPMSSSSLIASARDASTFLWTRAAAAATKSCLHATCILKVGQDNYNLVRFKSDFSEVSRVSTQEETQTEETNKQTARLLSRKWSNLALSLLLRFQQSH